MGSNPCISMLWLKRHPDELWCWIPVYYLMSIYDDNILMHASDGLELKCWNLIFPAL